jgi:nicotinate-nucleotide pyrophosphorylase (carboxylating)
VERLPDLTADAERVARAALEEDGPRDLTTETVLSAARVAEARLEYRRGGVVAGLAYASAVTRLAGCTAHWDSREGDWVEGPHGRLVGDLSAILRAERPLLNLLQRATGIATATRSFVAAVAGTRCRVLHTRKTAPGLRLFDVAAVVAGGGEVHRLDLARTVMVKDNHWKALAAEGRTLAAVLERARTRGASSLQVEVESAAQVEAACAAGADRLLVDNQDPPTVEAWGALARGILPGILVEATGGITLENVRAYALAGADFVSVGTLTHSVMAADIALELDPGDHA